MPRDPSGSYSLPAGNPVVSGTIISSTWANPTMDDLAVAMTDSLSRTGNGNMSVPLKIVSGTVAAPGISFIDEPAMGFHRPSVGLMIMGINGGNTVRYSASEQLEVWREGEWRVVSDITQAAGSSSGPTFPTVDPAKDDGLQFFNTTLERQYIYDAVAEAWIDTTSAGVDPELPPVNTSPVVTGSVTMWPVETPPADYLLCDGSAQNRTTFADLFAVLGVIYGDGDGSTTFNLPDYRGRFMRGTDDGAGDDPDAASRADRGDGVTGDNVGTRQNFALQNITGSLNVGSGSRLTSGSGAFSVSNATSSGAATGGNSGELAASFNASNVVETSTETRPRNIYINYIIKT